MQVFTRVQFETCIDIMLVEHIENRLPTPREFGKAFLDQSGRPLRPRVHQMPHQSARECRMACTAETLAGFRRHLHLIDCPSRARFRIVMDLRRRKTVEQFVIGRMRGNQLPLQVR